MSQPDKRPTKYALTPRADLADEVVEPAVHAEDGYPLTYLGEGRWKCMHCLKEGYPVSE